MTAHPIDSNLFLFCSSLNWFFLFSCAKNQYLTPVYVRAKNNHAQKRLQHTYVIRYQGFQGVLLRFHGLYIPENIKNNVRSTPGSVSRLLIFVMTEECFFYPRYPLLNYSGADAFINLYLAWGLASLSTLGFEAALLAAPINLLYSPRHKIISPMQRWSFLVLCTNI